jgi:poly-gamma-glutamate synthesis protein (capsule biosynthesis protein)
MSAPVEAPPLRVMFGGDTMLGRTVKERILRHGPRYPLGAIAPLMRQADLAIVNLECAITKSTNLWPGEPKAFYFGAPPAAVESLVDANVGLVNLANNHALDYDVHGLLDTLKTLDNHAIAHAGAGRDAAAAFQPAVVQCKHLSFGMAAFCDHQEDFAAATGRPGIAWLDLEDEEAALAVFADSLSKLSAAGATWPILSLHWGPNMVWRPAKRYQRLAHKAIDMGWKIVYGHSAHVFHGVELYRGCPILYATGDLVDDYYVDRDFRNDHQLLFELQLGPRALHRIVMHPVFIEDCRTLPATSAQRDWTFRQMAQLCREFGTETRIAGDTLLVEPAQPAGAAG